MSGKPRRIQLRRIKGWRLPPNTVVVSRPTKWGNPWTVEGTRRWLESVGVKETYSRKERAENCVEQYRNLVIHGFPVGPNYNPTRLWILKNIHHLRGKNLACWCKLDMPCHADVLLEVANGPQIKAENIAKIEHELAEIEKRLASLGKPPAKPA